MEDNPHNNISDRDRKMQQRGSFEGFADTSDDDDEEKEASKKSKKESAAFEQSKEETKAEKNQRDDDKLDELNESEAHHIVEEYAEARAEDLKEDLEAAQPDSLEEAVALANAALIEAIQENEPTNEEELDTLLAETIDELGLEAAEAEEDETEEDDAATTSATAPAAGGSGGTTPPPVVPTPPAAGGAPPPPVTPVTPVTPTPASPTLGGPLGGGALPPPRMPAAPNLAPAPSAATNTERWQPNRRRAGQLLLVGGVGYLIGRRRGRIKTEARLLPVQEKLEQEVKTLHDQIAERETKIRKLAAEKVLQQPETARPQLINRLESRVERRQQAQTERRQPAPEARPEAAVYRPPERLAKFVLPGAEVVRGAEVREKSIETMTMPELLMVAHKIEKNGITVKQMYENGRLDAEGLRRVVKEYLQGDHLDRVLADNLRPLESHEGEPLTPQKQADPVAGGFQTHTPLTPMAQQQLTSPQPPAPVPRPQPAVTPPPPRHNQANEVKTAVGLGLGAAVIILLLIILLS